VTFIGQAKEGIEDSEKAGRDDLISINLDPQVDVAVGIASSGRTPYVIGGLRYARQLGCLTIGIACTEPSEMSTILHSDEQPVVMHSIAAVVGPEVVTGSTRMKAGTATKLILNMISTGCMIRLGKTYGNLVSVILFLLKMWNLLAFHRWSTCGYPTSSSGPEVIVSSELCASTRL
jgi:N-acetylmuramic acid 6-phosphate etherase